MVTVLAVWELWSERNPDGASSRTAEVSKKTATSMSPAPRLFPVSESAESMNKDRSVLFDKVVRVGA
jgi:hypothetical protein